MKKINLHQMPKGRITKVGSSEDCPRDCDCEMKPDHWDCVCESSGPGWCKPIDKVINPVPTKRVNVNRLIKK